MFKATRGTFEGDKVPTLTKIIYPWSGIFRDACYALVGTFLLQYTITSGVLSTDVSTYTAQMSVITVAMMIALVWDGLNDPIMGFIIEKFHFKAGKFKPWILIGAIGNAICVFLMFIVRPSGWWYVTTMIIFYILWDLFFTMNDIGYWSMLPALTNDGEERAKLTTHVTVATTIGTFLMNILMFILPGLLPVSTATVYAIVASVTAILFLASQCLIYFLCQEKKRDPKQEEVSEKTHLLDLFKIVIKNKQLLFVVIAMLLYYLGAGLLTGIGLNYFYLLYGYGGSKGGMIATVISLFYVLGTISSQVFYPLLVKKLKKQTILTISAIIIIVSYIAFLFVAFPIFGDTPLAYNESVKNATDIWSGLGAAFGGSMWLLYVFSFLFFAASGIFYLVLLVMFQDAIDYQEWKYGERKESISFAWRPLDVKLASGLNLMVRNLTYIITGTAAGLNAISTYEGLNNAGYYDTVEASGHSFDSDIASALEEIKPSQLATFGYIVIGVIIVVFLIAYLILHFGYKIDEKMEKQIVDELTLRNKEDIKEEATLESEVNEVNNEEKIEIDENINKNEENS